MGELGRALKGVREDIAGLRRDLTAYVLREVYNAEKAALAERLAVERAADREEVSALRSEVVQMKADLAAARNSLRTAVYSCIGGGVLLIAGTVLNLLVK